MEGTDSNYLSLIRSLSCKGGISTNKLNSKRHLLRIAMDFKRIPTNQICSVNLWKMIKSHSICLVLVICALTINSSLAETTATKTDQTSAKGQTTSKELAKRTSLEFIGPIQDQVGADKHKSEPELELKSERMARKNKMTNAKLHKLLSQSGYLMKGMNETVMPGNHPTKNTNFKFVFIQRATVAPNSKASQVQEGSKISYSKMGTKTANQQPSLAASVSKQLASSLLYSAASLMGNLTSSGPSLTSLVAQTINSVTADPNRDSPLSSSSENLLDIKRISGDLKTKKTNGISKKTSGSKSKIYNLPVRFVANGQPNHVMFNSLKNHFATIKKLQSSAVKLSSIAGAIENGQKTKRRKNQPALKTKGNSRLIYLPLKYLSNAKPNKLLIGSKATHKSSQ